MSQFPNDNSPFRILMIEDNPADVMLTRDVLEDAKLLVELDNVENGPEALKYLNQEGSYEGRPLPDLILLDLNLPGMKGTEILPHIRNNSRSSNIPVVVLTSSAVDQDIQEAYHQGANSFITKPADLAQFAKIVESIEEFWFTIVRLPTRRNY
ncbi:MAG TPA: response regulator [Calditrichia bacterium]|nr:response regulator [Calditrichota bacterium]HQU70732.1 response regulator [Calditrichia bacterium]HQV32335.1 response regulator [Calditrichia bacterium]